MPGSALLAGMLIIPSNPCRFGEARLFQVSQFPEKLLSHFRNGIPRPVEHRFAFRALDFPYVVFRNVSHRVAYGTSCFDLPFHTMSSGIRKNLSPFIIPVSKGTLQYPSFPDIGPSECKRQFLAFPPGTFGPCTHANSEDMPGLSSRFCLTLKLRRIDQRISTWVTTRNDVLKARRGLLTPSYDTRIRNLDICPTARVELSCCARFGASPQARRFVALRPEDG